jgi:hypothetical protein
MHLHKPPVLPTPGEITGILLGRLNIRKLKKRVDRQIMVCMRKRKKWCFCKTIGKNQCCGPDPHEDSDLYVFVPPRSASGSVTSTDPTSAPVPSIV